MVGKLKKKNSKYAVYDGHLKRSSDICGAINKTKAI